MTRLHSVAVRAALLVLFASSAAFAQERLDLSGMWKLKPSGGDGGVGLAGRVVGAAYDTYSMGVTLPGGGYASLEATFDGTTLRTKLVGATTGGDAPATGTPGTSVGLARVVESGTATTTEGRTTPGGDARRAPDAPPPPREGSYRLTTFAETAGRPGAHRFEATGVVSPEGAMPVERFGRVLLKLQVRGAAEVATLTSTSLEARVLPSDSTGTFTWSASPADLVTLAPSGATVAVTGKKAGDATITCTFASHIGDSRSVTHALKVVPGIETVEVVGVTYVSDHGLLREYESDWGTGGSVPSEPEWTAAKQGALSHTMGQKVKVRLQLRCGPAGAAKTKVTVAGAGPVAFSQEVELTAGEMSVELESTTALPSRVQKLEFAVTWTAGALPVQPASTSNPMFVTIDTPHAQGNSPGFTTKRMAKAVELVAATNSLEPHAIVRPIISRYNNYNLRVAYHNAWELAEDKKTDSGGLVGADCQTIVRFTRDVIQQVGVQGTADYVVIYAHCKEPAKGLESLNARNHMTRPFQRHNDEFPDASKSSRSSWVAVLVDGDGGLNNYEAALRFEHGGKKSYYPGGVRAVFSDAESIIGVFTTMSWVSSDTGKYVVQEPHIHNYQR